jgi:hypothetical protein
MMVLPKKLDWNWALASMSICSVAATMSSTSGPFSRAVSTRAHPYPRCTQTRHPCGFPKPVHIPNKSFFIQELLKEALGCCIYVVLEVIVLSIITSNYRAYVGATGGSFKASV